MIEKALTTPQVSEYGAANAGRRFAAINIWILLFWSIGLFTNTLAYQSLIPLTAALLILVICAPLLHFTPIGGVWERRMFYRVFASGFAAMGIAAIYAEWMDDPSQLYSDASGFFEMARDTGELPSTLEELQAISEGSIAIIIWQRFYDLFGALGFERLRYIGLLLNIISVAFSGLIAIKIARLSYLDGHRLQRLVLLVSTCGLFWLSMGIHLRDSMVLLVVTSLLYVWSKYLVRPGLGVRLWWVIGFSVLGVLFFGFFRAEFAFVPIALLLAGTAALMCGRIRPGKRRISYLLAGMGLAALISLFTLYGEAIQLAFTGGLDGYREHVAGYHGASSLGMSLIVNQALPIRLVLGSVYLYIYPIPVWSGFQLDSAYQLFKSLNTIYFYFFFPLLALSFLTIRRDATSRTPLRLFLWFCLLGFTLSIAVTSLESRHLGAILIAPMVLALDPDLRIRRVRRAYRRLLGLLLASMAGIHVLWAALKFL